MKRKNLLQISLSLLFFHKFCYAGHVAIIGCGYVGLTLAGVLLNIGHEVTCIDIDREKISNLQAHTLPIYEPHLYKILYESFNNKNLTFTNDFQDINKAEIFYICVPTPTDSQGKCDCTCLFDVFNSILTTYTGIEKKTICIKSTIAPGTISNLKKFLAGHNNSNIQLVYNPEFMREGSAVYDIYHTNPIVLAGDAKEAIEKIEDLYRGLINPRIKIIKTNFETAEIIKYAWNSFSAIRVTYINELAALCRLLNADIFTVVKGLALSEELLPTEVIKPGPGYGGSCLPKDTLSFSKVLETQGFISSLVHQAIASNKNHKTKLFEEIYKSVQLSHCPTIAILGLSFKANTDDIRYSPAVDLIKFLMSKNVSIKAYDPKAMNNMKELFPSIRYCKSSYEAAKDADCLVVLTEWEEIKSIDLDKLAKCPKAKLIYDTRNIFNPQLIKKHGFTYYNMGAL